MSCVFWELGVCRKLRRINRGLWESVAQPWLRAPLNYEVCVKVICEEVGVTGGHKPRAKDTHRPPEPIPVPPPPPLWSR